jgi:integrase
VVSIHAQKNRVGNTYRVLWREGGRQRSLSFADLRSAERFQTLIDDHGPAEALRIIEADEVGRHVPTVTEWLSTHIDNLTGLQPATVARYRPHAGHRPCVRNSADLRGHRDHDRPLGQTARRQWKDDLEQTPVSVRAFNAAVRAGVIAANPCQGRRLPHTRVEETVLLTVVLVRRASIEASWNLKPRQYRQPLGHTHCHVRIGGSGSVGMPQGRSSSCINRATSG